MSDITVKAVALLMRADTPLTLAQLRAGIEGAQKGVLIAVLRKMMEESLLARTGKPLNFAYALTQPARDFFARHGAPASVPSLDTRPHRAAPKPKPSADHHGRQTLWPAMNRGAPLRPVISTALLWDNEDELPPFLGERYRDALRPRPRDD